jgi:hypothetical protein
MRSRLYSDRGVWIVQDTLPELFNMTRSDRCSPVCLIEVSSSVAIVRAE